MGSTIISYFDCRASYGLCSVPEAFCFLSSEKEVFLACFGYTGNLLFYEGLFLSGGRCFLSEKCFGVFWLILATLNLLVYEGFCFVRGLCCCQRGVLSRLMTTRRSCFVVASFL